MPDSPPSPWSDLDRPALDEAGLAAALIRDSGLWRRVEVVDEIGSTNAALLTAAADDAPDGSVLVAEHQAAGRGRLDRVWKSPPRAGGNVSFLVPPAGPAARPGRAA